MSEMMNPPTPINEMRLEEAEITKEPYYLPTGNEVKVFLSAFKRKLPLLLKGPTGCGKTRFIEYMAFKLGQQATIVRRDREGKQLVAETKDFEKKRSFIITVPCHEDLSANDLVGRYFLTMDQGAKWIDGPLTKAARFGGICYLDEIVEARKGVTVLLHSLTDYRRTLPLIKTGTVISAPARFMLAVSYNPGYQSVVKDLKPSTKQRFVSLDFDYPPERQEIEIVRKESGCEEGLARSLVSTGRKIRSLKNQGLVEGVSTRLLIYAAALITDGIPARDAVAATLISPLTDDEAMRSSLQDICKAFDLY